MRYLLTLLLIPALYMQSTAQTADELVSQAVLMYEAGEYTECLENIEKALTTAEDLSPQQRSLAHLYRGMLHLRSQMETGGSGSTDPASDPRLLALAEFQKARDTDDGSMSARIQQEMNQLYPLLFNAGVQAYNASLSATGDAKTNALEYAAGYVTGAYQIRPDNYKLSDLLGRIHYYLEQYEQSLGYYLTARRQYRPIRSREPDFSGISNIYLSAAYIFRDHLKPPSPDRALESVSTGLALLESEYQRFATSFSGNQEGHSRYLNGRKQLRGMELELLQNMPQRINEALTKFEAAIDSDFKDDAQMHASY
ncbi:MAG: hypothetical protein R3330_18485, partial [Saprospiraceae bacterium]|nr:hypothetical protein [Saprospiraceae bacterium]